MSKLVLWLDTQGFWTKLKSGQYLTFLDLPRDALYGNRSWKLIKNILYHRFNTLKGKV